jgi:MFS family permease
VAGRIAALRALFVEPPYARYIAGNSVSLIGTWMQRTAVGWHAWTLTGSPAWVGIAAFADLFPTLLVGPLGGVVADRLPRRRIMLVTQSLLALLAAAMALLAATDRLGILALVGLVALYGVLIGVNQPARLAYIPTLVPAAKLPAAVALNAMIFNGARFVGPAAAGLTIATGGVAAAFAANALSYLAFIWALGGIRVTERVTARAGQGWRAALGEGVLFLARHAGLGPVLLGFLLSALLARPVAELLPALAAELFAGGVGTLALLSSALGGGAVVGGLWIAGDPRERLLARCLGGLGGSTVAVALVLASPSAWLAAACLAATGFTFVMAGVSAQTLAQLGAPPPLRGRVMSLFGLVFRAGPALGALLGGLAAERLGLRPALALGLALFALVWLALWWRRAAIAAALAIDSRGPAH